MRSFTIESINKTSGATVKYTGGRFLSLIPSGAASKVFTKAYHHIKANGPLSLKITIRETTQNSLKKEYNYRVTRKAQTTEVERNGEVIIYNFITKTKSI
jgi:hypothetical protein